MKVTFNCKIIADIPSKNTSITEVLNLLTEGRASIDWAYSLDNSGEPTISITAKQESK